VLAKQRKTADEFLLCVFVFQHIPVLGKETVFESGNAVLNHSILYDDESAARMQNY
jgi:hypothetical protein